MQRHASEFVRCAARFASAIPLRLQEQMSDHPSYDLLAEARVKFGELGAAEEKVLRAAASGEIAYCGPSDKDDDPANDPAKAAEWGKDRTVRARLIRWLCVDIEAGKRVDPHGIEVHAAKIGDPAKEKELDLDAVTVSVPLYFKSCNFEVSVRLIDANLRWLDLTGSRIPGLRADGVTVSGSVLLREGFHAGGDLFLNGAEIGGQLEFSGAHFSEASSLILQNTTVKRAFFWRGLAANSPVRLDLRHASVGPLGDDEQSWPSKGNLKLDGFVYESIGEGPTGADKRLQWLARQPDVFVPQPYRQLAKVLRDAGDDGGAGDVLIAMENARLRHGSLNFTQRAVHRMLGLTVGYGYKPLRALWYIAFFVLLGTILFSWGRNSNVIVEVDAKYAPAAFHGFSPFVYSLESFLPLVNLRMAEHWMPDPSANPTPLLLPFTNQLAPAPPSLGRYLQWYLWLHILLGWFFASMLIAGVTGLVRHE